MNSFTFFKEYYELITLLSEKEQGELLLAINKYMFESIEPTKLNERQMKIFVNLKRPLDSSKNQSKRRTKKEPKKNQKETEEEPQENTSKMSMSLSMSNKSMSNLKVNNNLENIIDYMENNGFKLHPIDYEIISTWEDNDLTRYAIKQAVLNQKFSTKYVDRILASYKSKGITTVTLAMKDDEDFKKSKEQKYESKKTAKQVLEEYRKKEREEMLYDKT